MKIGLYAGSLDPITKGHIAVVKQSLRIVDQLHVVVAVNSKKNSMFDAAERVKLINEAFCEELTIDEDMRVNVDSVSNVLTTSYAKTVKATVLIRGLRNGQDYAYERSLAEINRKLAPEIETIFIPTPAKYEEVSSSTVKELMRYRDGEVAAREFVTDNVLQALRNKSHS